MTPVISPAKPLQIAQAGRRIYALCFLLLLTQAASAHSLPLNQVLIVAEERSLSISLTLPTDVLASFDVNLDGRLDRFEIEAQRQAITQYYLAGIVIENQDGQAGQGYFFDIVVPQGDHIHAAGDYGVRFVQKLRWQQPLDAVRINYFLFGAETHRLDGRISLQRQNYDFVLTPKRPYMRFATTKNNVKSTKEKL